MKVKYYIKNVEGLVIPKRANSSDAGYDVVATSPANIVGETWSGRDGWTYYKRIDYVEYQTNLYIAPDKPVEFDSTTGFAFSNFLTDLRPRSSISKYNLVLANSVGLIDRGYKNQILVRFKYIWQPEDFRVMDSMWQPEAYRTTDSGMIGSPNSRKIYNCGDKICQLLPVLTHDIEFQVMEYLDGDDRGGGFGSTGN